MARGGSARSREGTDHRGGRGARNHRGLAQAMRDVQNHPQVGREELAQVPERTKAPQLRDPHQFLVATRGLQVYFEAEEGRAQEIDLQDAIRTGQAGNGECGGRENEDRAG